MKKFSFDTAFLYGLLAYDVVLFLALSYCAVTGQIDGFNYLLTSVLMFALGTMLCIELERLDRKGE